MLFTSVASVFDVLIQIKTMPQKPTKQRRALVSVSSAGWPRHQRRPHLFLISLSKDVSLSYPNSPPAGRGTFMMSAWVATRTTCSGFFSLPPKAGGRRQVFHRWVLLPGCLEFPGGGRPCWPLGGAACPPCGLSPRRPRPGQHQDEPVCWAQTTEHEGASQLSLWGALLAWCGEIKLRAGAPFTRQRKPSECSDTQRWLRGPPAVHTAHQPLLRGGFRKKTAKRMGKKEEEWRSPEEVKSNYLIIL